MKIKQSLLEQMIKEELSVFLQKRIDESEALPGELAEKGTDEPQQSSIFGELKKLEEILNQCISHIISNNITFPRRQEAIRNIQMAISIIKRSLSGNQMETIPQPSTPQTPTV